MFMWSYFEKSMRSQLIMMKRSAQSEQQKMDILSNELVRRMSNVCDKVESMEKVGIVDHYTKQLKNSGYSWTQAREVVTCGLKGFMNKCERRRMEGKGFYRKARQTLSSRVRKKLMERTTWFKGKGKKLDEQEQELPYKKAQHGDRNSKGTRQAGNKTKHGGGSVNDVKSVIFITNTPNSILAKNLREGEEMLEKTTGYKMKIVERAGDSLEGLLHRSNPWSGADCARENCLLCETKQSNPKLESQNCRKRNVVYETWCDTCR